MFKKTKAVKKFVRRYKTRALVTSTAISLVVVAIQQRGIKQHDAFLKDKGLYDEFYYSEEQ